MPAILGVISRSEEPISERLEQMIRPLWRNPAWGVDAVHFPNGGFAAIRLDDSPGIASAAGTWLAANGLVFQQEDLIRRLENAGRPAVRGSSLSELLLQLFLAFGPEALINLNGSYAVAIWEEEPQRLTLLKDRNGTANLYYWQDANRLLFASEYKAIVAHPTFSGSIDEIALADFMLFNQVNGDRTFFQQIRSLPPSGMLTYQGGSVQIADYWDLPVGQYRQDLRSPADRRAASDGIVEEWAHHLQNAVRRETRPDTCLLITAGLDSRLLAACYKQINPQTVLQTTTIGVEGCREAEIGRQVAGALGYPHERIPLDTTYLAQYAARAAWRAEGKLNAFAAWIYRQEPYLIEHGYDYVMTGILGNAISGRYFPAELTQARVDAGEDPLRSASSLRRGWLEKVMRPDVFRRAVPASLDTRREAFRRSKASDPYGRYDELYFRVVLPRHAWKDEVLGDAAQSLAPYLDNDLVNFSLTIPPQLRAGGRLYRHMIVTQFPQVARLISDRSGRSIVFDHWMDDHPWLLKADHLARRVYRHVFREKRKHDVGACVPHNEAIRTGSREFVLDVLAQEEYLADFFDMTAANRVINDHLAGRRNLFWVVGGLLTFSLWRQQFFGKIPPDQMAATAEPMKTKSQ